MRSTVRDWKRRNAVVALVALAIAASVTLAWLSSRGLPKRFGVVVPGQLYRSGEVSPRQLEQVAREHGINTVLSLLNPDVPESIAERQAAERLGVRWVNVPLRGDGSSTPADRELIKETLFDPAARPLLVHCAAGANRTGLTIGMYRMYVDGWTPEQVLAEMRTYDFEDLPKHENLRAALRAEWEAIRKEQETPQVEEP